MNPVRDLNKTHPVRDYNKMQVSNGTHVSNGMKILHVTTHMNIGGISNYILTLSAALRSVGAEVIVASSGGDLEEVLAREEIKHLFLNLDTKFEFHPKVFAAAVALRGIIRSEGIDIIHAHTRVSQVAAFAASRLTGIPYVTTCHGYFRTRSRKVFDTWGRRVIAISDAVRDHLEKDLGVKRERINLVYSGVDAEKFSTAAKWPGEGRGKESLGLGPGPVVGNIGRLSPVKGQKFLLRAMSDVMLKKSDAQLLIVGSGPDEKTLKSLAMALGIEKRTYFAGADPDTCKFLAAMDVFVFPSIKEGLGIGLLEALAAGRACVASRVGGIGNMISHGSNGMLVDPEDVTALSGAISRLLDDAGMRKAMGSTGRKFVIEKFSLERMAREIFSVYEDTLRR